MKKIVTLSLVAIVTLGLAACNRDNPGNSITIENEIILNSEDASLDNLGDNPEVADTLDNGSIGIDNASTVPNTSVDLPPATTNATH